MWSLCRRCASASRSTRLSTAHLNPVATDSRRASSSTASSHPPQAEAKRPSPYRLIPVSTFLADFAPLHVKGWRLDNLPHVRQVSEPKEGGMVELQDRRLMRHYDFEQGKEGWRDLLRFVQVVGEAVEAEDHHPSISITPASDFTSFPPVSKTVGYVLAISTHTHTPLPPLKFHNKDQAMRPGVTGKDMKLANKLEELYEGVRRT